MADKCLQEMDKSKAEVELGKSPFPILVKNVTKIYKKHRRINKYETLKGLIVKGAFLKKQSPDYIVALNNISLRVPRGQTVGIIGSNGAGKSTLLKIIAGLSAPTSGEVIVDGRVSALIELGAGFHPEISGRENIFINGIMLGLSKQQVKERFNDIVKYAELEEFIDNPVKTYSSGMYMRLGFSVAIHVDPEILLIDEILAVGDEAFVHKCTDKLYEFKRQKKTILMVSHSLFAVERLCDYAYWMENGEIQEHGEPKKVIGSYLQFVHQKEQKRYQELHDKAQKTIDERISSQSRDDQTDECRICHGVARERWGSREVEITRVRVLDSQGKERYAYTSGEEINIVISFKAKTKIEEPVFGIGIFSANEVWCYGTNTQIEKIKIKYIEGEGEVVFSIPRLDLVQGSYMLDVAVHGEDGYPYDYHTRLHTISILSDIKDAGIFRPPHRWSFRGGIALNGDKR